MVIGALVSVCVAVASFAAGALDLDPGSICRHFVDIDASGFCCLPQFIPQLSSLRELYHLIHTAELYCIRFLRIGLYLSLLSLAIGTLYFIGCVRFETPVESPSPSELRECPTCRVRSTTSPVEDIDTHQHLWLYECQHNQGTYLSFPPYCAPGGLRSRLFPQTAAINSEEDKRVLIAHTTCESCSSDSEGVVGSYRTTDSTSNPLDLILNNSYLPLPSFVRQQLLDRRNEWTTLGGSQCSYKRYLLTLERENEFCDSKDVSSKQQHKEERAVAPFGYSFKSFKTSARHFLNRAVSSSLAYFESSISSEIESQPTQTETTVQDQHQQLGATMSPAQQTNDTSPPASGNVRFDDNPAGKPIPQAVLVYHESAHSIVFRDHLRRQQSVSLYDLHPCVNSLLSNANHTLSVIHTGNQTYFIANGEFQSFSPPLTQ